MADQAMLVLHTELEQLTPAELASLVIELVGDERVAVPLGEELYRRLNRAARPAQPSASEWLRHQPAPTVSTLARSSHT